MTPPTLTPRQREIWRRIADCQPSKQIAHELGIKYRTVGAMREQLYLRLGCNNAIQCTRMAIRWGVVAEPVVVQPEPSDKIYV